jgi:ribose 5-phosphate isomerase B
MYGHLPLQFASAGLSAAHGLPASRSSAAYAATRDLGLDDHRSQPVTPELLRDTAWVIGMTRSHAAIFRSRFGRDYGGAIGVLGAPGLDLAQRTHAPDVEEVADPYGMSQEHYFACGDQVYRLLQGWRPAFSELAHELHSRARQSIGPGVDAMKIAIGSDHRGFAHKALISESLRSRGIAVEDFGCASEDAADYPDAALHVAEAVATGQADAGVLICGSGIGMSIAANKVKGIRASLCFTEAQARTTREHNDSNVLCLSGDGVDPARALALTDAWLAASFAGGRHARRVDKIIAYENQHSTQE